MIFLNGTSGLNTVEDPTSINYDPKTGISDLAEAVNVQISPNGGIERVGGFLLKQSGSFHSLFCENEIDCLVGRTTTLQAVNTDDTLTGVRSGLTGDRIAYCQVAEAIFYSNGTQNGMVKNKISYSWEYNDPSVSRSNHVMEPVPVATHLDFFSGRIFFTLDDLLCWTELGLHGIWSPTVNSRRFGTRIRMIKHVDNGMFVSDEKGTYFLEGKDPHSWRYNHIANYPAYEWSETGYVEGLEIGLTQPGLCALWSSPEGACLGTSTGQIINLNREKVIYPENGSFGASLLYGFQFINSIV